MSISRNKMEMPAFGRPFQLGMLYDATSDKRIQGNELWDKETIQKAQKENLCLDTQFSVILDDSLATKNNRLGANCASVRANLLTGMTHVSGAAKFLSDHKVSREVNRIAVHFKFTSRAQELDVQQLGQIQNQAVISATRATHVVTKILFGLEAVLVIDRPYSTSEDASFIQKKIENCAEFLANMYDSGMSDLSEIDLDQKETEKYIFKFYSDTSVPTTSPLSLKEVVSLLQDLLKFFKQGRSCSCLVPNKVWMYPLINLDSAAPSVAEEVNNDHTGQIEKVIEDLNHVEVWISDISKSNIEICSTVSCFQQQQAKFSSLVKLFKSDLLRKLSAAISEIRKNSAPSDQLSRLLKVVADSPFAPVNLSTLLKSTEQEIRAVALCLKSVSSIKFASADELESLGYEYEHILSFELRLGGVHSTSLDKMEKYIKTQTIDTSDSSSNTAPWYNVGSKKRALQLKANAFKEFSQLNSNRTDITFVVSVNTEISGYTGEVAATLLYADDSPVEFDISSKPVNIAVQQTAKSEATLSWSKPKIGSTNIIAYTVQYRIVKNPPDDWICQKTGGVVESLQVSNLVTDSTYEFVVQAECKIGKSLLSEGATLKISPISKSTETSISVEEGLGPISTIKSPQGNLSHASVSTKDGVPQLPLSTMAPYSLTPDMSLLTRSMPQFALLPNEQASGLEHLGYGAIQPRASHGQMQE